MFFQCFDLRRCYLTFLIQPLTVISKGRPHYQLTPENKTFPGSFEWAPAGTGSLRPTPQGWSAIVGWIIFLTSAIWARMPNIPVRKGLLSYSTKQLLCGGPSGEKKTAM